MKVKLLSHVRLFATPWTVAYQVPPSMGFSRQEYWNGLSFPSPGDLSNSGIRTGSPTLAGGFFTTEPPGKLNYKIIYHLPTRRIYPGGTVIKNLTVMWETWVQSLDQEYLLEKEMATHSSVLAWKIPWMEKPGRLQSMGSQRVG